MFVMNIVKCTKHPSLQNVLDATGEILLFLVQKKNQAHNQVYFKEVFFFFKFCFSSFDAMADKIISIALNDTHMN